MAFCEERKRLVEAYAAATESFSGAVETLRTSSAVEFLEALTTTETARSECTKARCALRDHKVDHGCYDSPRPRRPSRYRIFDHQVRVSAQPDPGLRATTTEQGRQTPEVL